MENLQSRTNNNNHDYKYDLGMFIRFFRRDFESELSKKTGWGRNELMIVLEQCISSSMIKLLEIIQREENATRNKANSV